MKKLLWITVFSVISTCANAGPITTVAGEEYLFNFSFDPTPSTISSSVFFTQLVRDSLDLNDTGEWTLYEDLNAAGTLIQTESVNLSSVSGLWLDGTGSALLRMTAGSLGTDPIVIFILSDQSLVTVEPQQSVPAPATLALMGLGLAGLGWKRRKG